MEKPESKMKEHRVHGISSRIDSMSPQGISHARRDRLKTRCLERIKERRSHLVDAFRQGTARNHMDVFIQEEKEDDEISKVDYIDLIAYLEEALDAEMKDMQQQQQLQEALDYEEASLAAAIDNMEINSQDSTMICPSCCVHKVMESKKGQRLFCQCGFRVDLQQDAVGIHDFQIAYQKEYHAHCTLCAEEPRIEVNNSLGQVDIVYLNCDVCHYFKVIV